MKDKKIVQAWHFAEEGWPDDHFSICTFLFTETATGTKLELTQTNVPTANVKRLKDGWKQYYWEPMKAMLSKASF